MSYLPTDKKYAIPTRRLPSEKTNGENLVRSHPMCWTRGRGFPDEDRLIPESPTEMFMRALKTAANKHRLS